MVSVNNHSENFKFYQPPRSLSLSLDSKTFIMLVIKKKKKLNQIVMMCTTLFLFYTRSPRTDNYSTCKYTPL